MCIQRVVQIVAFSAFLIGLVPGSTAAQGLRFLPSIGLYVPVAEIGEVEGIDGAIELGKVESTLALGLAAEFSGSGSLGIRANLGYATASDVPIDGVGCETCDARSTVLIGTAALTLRPVPRILGLQPYLLAGGGIKRYDFDPENFDDEGFEGVLDDQTQGTVQLGLGADFSLGGLGLFTELNGYIGRVDAASGDYESDSDLQTDFIFSLGLALGGG